MALLLTGSISGLALAQSSDAGLEERSADPPRASEGALPPKDALEEAQEDYEREEKERGSAKAKAEREKSRRAYAGADDEEAIRIAKDNYGDVLSEPPWRPLEGEDVKDYLSNEAAVLGGEDGEPDALVESVLPLRTTEGGESRPVDLTLEDQGDYIEPENALVGVRIGERLTDGLVLDDIGVTLRPTAADTGQKGAGQDAATPADGNPAEDDNAGGDNDGAKDHKGGKDKRDGDAGNNDDSSEDQGGGAGDGSGQASSTGDESAGEPGQPPPTDPEPGDDTSNEDSPGEPGSPPEEEPADDDSDEEENPGSDQVPTEAAPTGDGGQEASTGKATLVAGKPFYPNVATDTDFFATAIPGGVETYWQLRSEDSPESLGLKFDLPSGAELRTTDGEAVEIVRDDEPLALISTPAAYDADGMPVAVSTEVDGDAVVLKIAHRGQDLAYPLLVDPHIEENFEDWKTRPNLDFVGWTAWSNRPFYTDTNHSGFRIFAGLDGSGRNGLHVKNPDNSSAVFNAGDAGEWYFAAPGSAYIYKAKYRQWMERPITQPRGLCTSNGLYSFANANWEPGAQTTWQKCDDFSDNQVKLCVNPSCEHDRDRPTPPVIVPGASTVNWTNASSAVLTASATDTGLGLKTFRLFRIKPDGTGVEMADKHHPCTGDRLSRCPATWAPNPANTSWTTSLSFSTLDFPEGDNTYQVYSKDVVANEVASPTTAHLKLDRTPPQVTLSGTLWDRRNNPEDHRFEGLYGPDYQLRIATTDGVRGGAPKDQRSGVDKITVKVDGVQKLQTLPQTCTGDSCPLAADWNLHSDDFPDGEHTITVTATDRLGQFATKELVVTVDRRGDVFHARAYTKNPALGGELLTKEWAQPGTFVARSESETRVAGRSRIPCNKHQEGCDVVRKIHRMTEDAPNGERTYKIVKGKAGHKRIRNISSILVEIDADEEPKETGPITNVLNSWQHPPPTSGDRFERYDHEKQEDGERLKVRTYVDAVTKMPVKTETRDSAGNTVGVAYWTYDIERTFVTDHPADFFCPRRPGGASRTSCTPDDTGEDSAVHVTDIEMEGASPLGDVLDAETNASFDGYSVGLVKTMLTGGASSDLSLKTFCLASADRVKFSYRGKNTAAERGRGDPSLPAAQPLKDQTFVSANYVIVSSEAVCVPGVADFDLPALDVVSYRRAGTEAAVWRDAFRDQATWIETNGSAQERETGGRLTVIVSGQATTAYVVPHDGGGVSALLDIDRSTVILTGPFTTATLPAAIAVLERR